MNLKLTRSHRPLRIIPIIWIIYRFVSECRCSKCIEVKKNGEGVGGHFLKNLQRVKIVRPPRDVVCSDLLMAEERSVMKIKCRGGE